MNEAETCRTLVRPRLEATGWEANGERHYHEQVAITAGHPLRLKERVSDFLLCLTRDVPLAVVEAMSYDRPAGYSP